MYKTERILIKPGNERHQFVHRLCLHSAKIYNQGLYYLRQAFFNHEKLYWQQVDTLLKCKHRELYSKIPNAISQQILKKLGKDFKSFWQAHKAYKKQPSRFKARPRIPHYMKHKSAKTAIQPAQGLSVVNGQLKFPKKLNLAPLKIHCCAKQVVREKTEAATVIEIRYVPHGTPYSAYFHTNPTTRGCNSSRHSNTVSPCRSSMNNNLAEVELIPFVGDNDYIILSVIDIVNHMIVGHCSLEAFHNASIGEHTFGY